MTYFTYKVRLYGNVLPLKPENEFPTVTTQKGYHGESVLKIANAKRSKKPVTLPKIKGLAEE